MKIKWTELLLAVALLTLPRLDAALVITAAETGNDVTFS